MTPPPRTSRLWPWLRRGLLACYITACLLLGTIYIGLGALKVPQDVLILGSTRAVAGQPWVMLARIDAKQTHPEATLRVDVPGGDGLSQTLSFGDSLRAETFARIPIPPTSAQPSPSPPTLPLSISLTAPNSWISGLPLNLSLVPPLPPPDDLQIRTFPAPTHNQPLDVSWVPSGGKLISFIQNDLHIRVLDPATRQPVEGARVLWLRTYGEVTTGPTDLTTDALGLTTFTLTPQGASVWEVQVTDAHGLRPTKLQRQLEPWPAAPRLSILDAHLTPQENLHIQIDSLRSGAVYADLWLNGAFIERWVLDKPEGRLSASLDTSRLQPLTAPALASLMVCWSWAGCGEQYSLSPLLWTPSKPQTPPQTPPPPDIIKRPTPPELIAALELFAAHHPDDTEAAFATWGAAQLKAHADTLSDAQMLRLYDFVKARWAELTPSPSLELVFDSGPILQQELSDLRTSTKGQLNSVFALLVVGGGLLLAGWMLGMSVQRQRAMAAEMGDADMDVLESASAKMERWVWRIEVVMVVVVLTSFLWGVYLGFQHL
jgi:hypothetical protein